MTNSYHSCHSSVIIFIFFSNRTTFVNAVIEEVGEENTEHDDDEDSTEDQKEIFMKIEFVLRVDDRCFIFSKI